MVCAEQRFPWEAPQDYGRDSAEYVITDDSMSPEFVRGDRVHPAMTRRVKSRDFVILLFRGHRSLVRQIVIDDDGTRWLQTPDPDVVRVPYPDDAAQCFLVMERDRTFR